VIEFIGILLAFILIFLLTVKRVNLGPTLLLASLILGLTSGLNLRGFLEVARLTVTDYTTYELLFSIGLISILGNCLKETGLMVELIENLKGYFSSRFLIALIPALFGLLPIILAILLNILGVPLPIAILAGVLVVLSMGGLGFRRSIAAIWRGVPWGILLALVGIMFFRYTIKEAGSVTLLFMGLREAGVPVLVLATVFPFLMGLISGAPSSGIGIGVPLVLPLFSEPSLTVLGLIYFSIVTGYLLSPLHLCLVLTNAYYKSDLGKVYRILAPSILTLYATGLLYFLPRL